MAEKIIYTDKENLIDNENIPNKNKVTADDMNEIKEVVNSNADSLEILDEEKADRTEIPTDLSELSNENTKFVNETQLANAVNDEKTARQEADTQINNTILAISVDYGKTIELSLDSSTFVLTASLKNKNGTVLSSSDIDLPIESMIVDGRYNNVTKTIVLTLQNGNTITIPVADLISGLQSEITLQNKLSSDLVDDTNHTNKFVTQSQKEQIETNKNDITNLSTDKEDKSNKVTELSNESTDTQYPSAKVVYDNETQIKEKLDRYSNTIETELGDSTDTGTDLTLNGTAEYDVGLKLSGNTSQETTKGYQMIPQPSQDTSSTNAGINYDSNSDGTYHIHGTATSYSSRVLDIKNGIIGGTASEHYSLLEAGDYTYKATMIEGTGFRIRPRSGTTGIESFGIEKTFNIAEAIADFNIFIEVQSGTTIDVTFKIMLEKGTVAHDWEKYTGETPSPNQTYPQTVQVVKGNNEVKIANSDNTQSQTYPITLPTGMEMCKIGDYADKFVWQNNKWYKNHKINKAILDGTEDHWNKSTSYQGAYYRSITYWGGLGSGNALFCNYLKYESNSANYSIGKIFNNNNYVFWFGDATEYPTVASFTSMLANKYANGNPVIVYYILATPTLEEITDTTLINQLNNIKEAYTYQGQTNITQTNEDLPFIIKADFKLSNLSRIEALENALETVSSRVDLLEE